MLDIRPDAIDDPWLGLSEDELEPLESEAHLNASDDYLDLSRLPAGVFLAAGLANIDFDRLSGHSRVLAVAAIQRLVSHYQAKMYEGVASVYDYLEVGFEGDIELATGATAAEIRAALRLTRRCADVTVDLALALADRLPGLREEFLAGTLDVARVKIMVSGTEHLPADAAQEVIDQVLAEAPTLTTGQLAARLRRLCVEVDPDEAADRYRSANDDRRVELRPDAAGTGHVFAFDLDPTRAGQAMNRIDHLARSLKAATETRTMDQLRADVFLDLLGHGSHPADTAGGPSRSTTHVTVDLETLIGLANRPAELAGFGPIVAELARNAATESGRWDYSIRDGDSGDLIAAGTARRRPTAAQARAIRAISRTCVFPGCRMPATNCDLDHIEAFASGGPTTVGNLAPACRHDHTIKHRYGWTYRPVANGFEWTSRLGLKHSTDPP